MCGGTEIGEHLTMQTLKNEKFRKSVKIKGIWNFFLRKLINMRGSWIFKFMIDYVYRDEWLIRMRGRPKTMIVYLENKRFC